MTSTENLTSNSPATVAFYERLLIQDRVATYGNPNGSIWGPETGTN
jgi:hypothetical protein